MIKGYLQTRAQDGLSLLIAAALAAYGCVSVGLTAVDFEIVEDPFQQLFVSNWNSRTLIAFYIPLFLLFLFFHVPAIDGRKLRNSSDTSFGQSQARTLFGPCPNAVCFLPGPSENVGT